jgi:hypothetical protein
MDSQLPLAKVAAIIEAVFAMDVTLTTTRFCAGAGTLLKDDAKATTQTRFMGSKSTIKARLPS